MQRDRSERGIESESSLKRWQEELHGQPPEAVLRWAAARWPGRLAVFTSFQADGMVVIDLVARLGLRIPILTLDTGRLPQETYDHWDAVRRYYGVAIEPVFPEAGALSQLVGREGPNLFRNDPERRLDCCRVRKVEPFRREIGRFDAWISGLRRGQSSTRREMEPVERDLNNDPSGRLFKVSPFVEWSLAEVWEYLRRHHVPTHPLYEQGYHSIGCAPCSRPLRPAEDPRATRWWWEGADHRECGLHFGASLVGSS